MTRYTLDVNIIVYGQYSLFLGINCPLYTIQCNDTGKRSIVLQCRLPPPVIGRADKEILMNASLPRLDSVTANSAFYKEFSLYTVESACLVSDFPVRRKKLLAVLETVCFPVRQLVETLMK